jgi:hypothetical protein
VRQKTRGHFHVHVLFVTDIAVVIDDLSASNRIARRRVLHFLCRATSQDHYALQRDQEALHFVFGNSRLLLSVSARRNAG